MVLSRTIAGLPGFYVSLVRRGFALVAVQSNVDVVARCFPWASVFFALMLIGCSEPGGFYVSPEFKDLGVVRASGAPIVAEFEIVNRLADPVRVTNIFPSCQCTTVGISKNPIAAGSVSILKVEAHLSKQTGEQAFSVTMETDNPSFPRKTLSFKVFVATEEEQHRSLTIGSIYPDSRIAVGVPTKAFSQGEVRAISPPDIEGQEADNNDETSGVSAVLQRNGGQHMLFLAGRAPSRVGRFTKMVNLREHFVGTSSAGDGDFELELVWNVIPRWRIDHDLYAGFITADVENPKFMVVASRTAASALNGPDKDIVKIEGNCDPPWVRLQRYECKGDRIELEFGIDRKFIAESGPHQSKLDLAISYDDGTAEVIVSKVYANVER